MPAIDVFGAFVSPLEHDQGQSKLVNCRVIIRKAEEQKLTKVIVVGTPGLREVCQPTMSPCIALCQAVGEVWSAHADGSIYYGIDEVPPNPVLAGTVAVGDPPIIRLAEDRTCLVIASNGVSATQRHHLDTGGTGYTATVAGGVVDAGFAASINFDPSSCCVLDGFTVWAGASDTYANQADKMYSSEPLDPANVDPNAWATAEARSDECLDVVTLGRMFWPFGTRSVEMWYDPGGQIDFKFTNFTNSLIEVGLAARRTLASLHGKAMWVGTDRRVWIGGGQSGSPASPGWVDLLLQQIDLQQLTAFAYSQGGEEFYVLTLEGKWSLELTVSTMLWAYRHSPDRPDYAARCAVEHDGGMVYIGLDTGEICLLDVSLATEPSGRVDREITTMWIGMQETRHVVNHIDITSYMGPEAGEFTLDWSEDRKANWRGQRTITWPEPGIRRAIGRAFGSSRRRQFRLAYNGSAAPFALDEFFVDVSQGA